ncbi:hypothetical protein AGROH133_12054 [Agrobacterium tumefaciens]|nr:hypothetical protein AGROH133_12054 [Agrobacterium tumefaciens]
MAVAINALHVCSQCATGCGLSALLWGAMKGDARRGVSNDTAGPKCVAHDRCPCSSCPFQSGPDEGRKWDFFRRPDETFMAGSAVDVSRKQFACRRFDVT